MKADPAMVRQPGEEQRARIDEQNPWPGLGAFDEDAQRFFNGRRNEAAELRRLVMSAPLTVVFGVSGLGKTSLLQAGLFPQLRMQNVLPVYVRLDVRGGSASLIDQAKDAMLGQFQARQVDAPMFGAGESLWEWLHRDDLELWNSLNQLLTPLFVLDQFEEVFTLGAENAESIARLRIDLADLVENRVPATLAERLRRGETADSGLSLSSQRYKVLISFREDYLPAVEGWKRDLPSIMRNRLRLLPMSAAQAFEAVHKTAPHLTDETIAREIVRFVAAAQEGEGGPALSSLDREIDLAVEPALLSLVCHGLNERRKAQAKAAFDLALLKGTGQAIISDYYRDAIAGLPEGVHRFIEEELITERGYRKPCDIDDARSVHGVTDRDLQLLVGRRLLRIEPHHGTERIELTHDLLTRVVREHRDGQRERQRVRRQNKRLFVLFAIGAALIAVALMLFAMYRSEKASAIRATVEAQRARDALVRSDVRDAAAAVSADRPAEALAYLARALRTAPDDVAVRSWVSDLLLRRTWWVPVGDAMRHDGAINSARFSATGSLVATASEDHTARVWDANTGRPAGEPMHHTLPVHTAEFNPDGSRLITTSGGTARIWQTNTGKAVHELIEPALGISSGAFAPDGQSVVLDLHEEMRLSGAAIWNPAVGKQIIKPPAMPNSLFGNIYDLFSPDLKRALTAAPDGRVMLWELSTPPRSIGETIKLGNNIAFADFSPDGKRILTASSKGVVEVWESSGKRAGKPIEHHAPLRLATFNADGSRILTLAFDGIARLWNALSGEPVAQLVADSAIRFSALSPDGSRVLTVSADGVAQVWTIDGRRDRQPLQHPALQFASFSSDSRRIVTASREGTAQIWEAGGIQAASPLTRYPDRADRWASALSRDGKRALTALNDNTARIWETVSGNEIALLRHSGPIAKVEFSEDGSRVLTLTGDGTTQVWDTTGRLIGKALHHPQAHFATFSPNAERVATISNDHTVRVWETRTGNVLGKPLKHDSSAESAIFNPDGTWVVTIPSTGIAQIWDAASGMPKGGSVKHEGMRIAVFSPDGRRLLTASDESAQMWDTETGKPLAKPMLHDRIGWASFSRDGAFIVIATSNDTGDIWTLFLKDAKSGAPVGQSIQGHGSFPAFSFSADGSRLATAFCSDKVCAVRVWETATLKPLGSSMEGIDPADGSSQVAFSADGTTLTLLSSGGRVQRWDLLLGSGKDSELLADTGEALGGYTLSQQGTLTALPDQAYRLGKLREAGRGAAEFESTARSYLRRLFLPVKP